MAKSSDIVIYNAFATEILIGGRARDDSETTVMP